MTKAELLAKYEADSLGIVHTNLVEEGALENGKTYKKYNVNVLAVDGDSKNFINYPFTVVNEGQADEEAFSTQGRGEPKPDVVRNAISTYIDGLTEVVRYTIGQVDEDERYALVSVYVNNGDGTASQKQYFVYKDGTSPITHLVLS